VDRPGLKAALDGLYEDYNREVGRSRAEALLHAPPFPARGSRAEALLHASTLPVEQGFSPALRDPVQIVHRYEADADREVMGFVASALAFGRVASVMQSVERVAAAMGPSPAAFVRRFQPSSDGAALLGITHRWARGEDLVALLWVLRQILDRSGSLESFFLEGDDPSIPDVGRALESFSARALSLDLASAYGRVPARPGIGYFFPRPSCGSACKRLNLYLRWMVRHDAIDMGVWRRVSAARLIVPLDVHVIRLGRCLGLTRYTSPGWRMAADITASLRAMDPRDPARYDFALCHVGMRDQCGFRRPIKDERCPLRGFCRPRARTRRASHRPSGRR
jgi:uncharacterized protein (TIGR02757 family)